MRILVMYKNEVEKAKLKLICSSSLIKFNNK